MHSLISLEFRKKTIHQTRREQRPTKGKRVRENLAGFPDRQKGRKNTPKGYSLHVLVFGRLAVARKGFEEFPNLKLPTAHWKRCMHKRLPVRAEDLISFHI